MDLRYDGAPYLGWQSQPNGQTVQDALERALATLFRQPTRIMGASRTDTGVHAEHQVAMFSTKAAYDEGKWLHHLRGLLGGTIGVYRIVPVDGDFHPVRSARSKIYRYRLWRGVGIDPWLVRYSWHIHRPLDLNRLATELHSAVGLQDFSSFCAADSAARSKVRRVLDIRVEERGPLINLWFSGEGFLKQMIRRLVGASVNLATRGSLFGMQSLLEALEKRDPKFGRPSAPALGLTLVQISYDEVASIDSVMRIAEAGATQGLPRDFR